MKKLIKSYQYVLITLLSAILVSCTTNYLVKVRTNPPAEVKVYVDGEYKGTTSKEGNLELEPIKKSIYSSPIVEIREGDYKGWLIMDYVSKHKGELNVKTYTKREKDHADKQIYDITFSVPDKIKTEPNSSNHVFSNNVLDELKRNENDIFDYNNIILFQTLENSGKGKAISFSPDDNFIVTENKVWKKTNTKFSLFQTLQNHYFGTKSLGISNDGKYLLSGGKYIIKVWKFNENSFTNIKNLEIEDRWNQVISCIKFSPEGNCFATADALHLKIWSYLGDDFSLLQSIKPVVEDNTGIKSLSYSPNGKYIATIGNTCTAWFSKNERLRLWKKNDDGFSEIQTINESFNNLSFSPNNNYFVTSTSNNLQIWEMKGDSFSLIQSIENAHINTINSVAFSPDGKYIVSSSDKEKHYYYDYYSDDMIKLWKRDKNKFLHFKTVKGHPNSSECISFSNDGTLLVSSNKNKTTTVYLLGKLGKLYEENELKRKIELEKIEILFAPKDEFETEIEYENRLEKGKTEKSEINHKYDLLFADKSEKFYEELELFKQRKNAFVQSEIRKSIHEIVKNIDKIGEYNAENETFPITINNISEYIKIPRALARSFKANLDTVKVTGERQLKEDLETYEDINLYIIHPITGDKYAFGEHKSLYKVPERYLITITTEKGNIRENPSTNSRIIKKSSRGDTFPVIDFNNPWYNIKINDEINGFVHQSICSESQIQTTETAIKPPFLKLTAELKEPSGNGFLDGEEKGEIVVQITNSGEGPAFGVIVDIKNNSENSNLSYSRTRVPGEIAPDETKEITFDIEANKNISRETQTFTILALESNGFSPDTILLTFETNPIQLPEISLIDYGVITASGDSEIIPGETANITLRFQNIEQGNAENLVFKMNLPNNVYFNPESKKEYSFDTFNSGEYKDVEFSILTSNEVNEQIELVISMNEKHISKKYSLILEINKPLKSIQEFVQTGIEEDITPIFIASDLTVDISKDIPKCKQINSDAIAVVIGNKNYLKAKRVEYAINDAILMKEYLIKSFGYKEGNIFFLKNASKGEFELYFGTKDNHRGKLFNAVKEGSSDIFVFYSGHGAPSLNNKKGYFVPVECDPNYVELSGYSLQTFYDNLSKVPAKSQTIVLDACFSGSDIFENISPIITKSKNPIISLDNGIVFSSSKDTEVSSWYNEKKHGMFTYFFLKSIHNKNADLDDDNKLTANEIIKYISNNSEGVPYYSRRIHGVEQNPQLFGKNKKRVIVNYD